MGAGETALVRPLALVRQSGVVHRGRPSGPRKALVAEHVAQLRQPPRYHAIVREITVLRMGGHAALEPWLAAHAFDQPAPGLGGRVPDLRVFGKPAKVLRPAEQDLAGVERDRHDPLRAKV